jgi:hypothetical protein
MKNSWGWETPEDRLKRHARIPMKRKLQALEQMRKLILKYGVVAGRQQQVTAS